MPHLPDRQTDWEQPATYQIGVEGHLGGERAAWFEGLTIVLEEDGRTLLTGQIADQASLYGLLRRIRDLGMPLLSVGRVSSRDSHQPRSNKGAKT